MSDFLLSSLSHHLLFKDPSSAALEQSPLLSIATGIDADLPILPGLAANPANMFCSPIQPADPFDFFTRPPHHAYRRRQAYNDPITTALLNEQARREAAYERERQHHLQQRRRAAYEEQLKREAAILKARRIAAARQEYERQLRDLFLQGYRPARQDWQQTDDEEEQEEEEEEETSKPSTSQSYIPIRSYTDAKQSESEVDMQDMGSESESESEAEEEEEERETDQMENDNVTHESSTPQRIHIEQTEGSKPKLTYDEAVTIVQKHASSAITIRQRLRALEKIRSAFTEKQSQFRPPAT